MATTSQPLRAPYVSPLQKLAFASLLLFLFLLHSRVLDLTLSFLHIPILSLYVAVLASFLGGGFLRAFTHRIGILLLLITAWMTMGIPFSVWPGGSIETVRLWVKTLLVFFVIAGLISTFKQWRRTVYLLAFSILVLAIMAVLFGNMSSGRLILDRGRFTNPNDLAQILLMGLPFWWYIATNPRLTRPRRILAYLAVIPIFMAMSKTGSRGALVAALIVGLVFFWRSSVSNKVALIVGVCVLVLLGAIFLPQSIKERYFTFFSANDTDAPQTELEANMEQSAVSSAWGRWELLQDSIALTFYHPVFGVGAGQFMVAQDVYSRAARGHKGAWQVTHNTFTEFSSENGIPVLLFFILAIWYSFKASRLPRYPRPEPGPNLDEVTSAAFCLRLSLLSYTVSSLFGSFAYQTQFLVLAGLAITFQRTAGLVLSGVEDAAPRAPAPPRRLSPKLRQLGRMTRPSPALQERS